MHCVVSRLNPNPWLPDLWNYAVTKLLPQPTTQFYLSQWIIMKHIRLGVYWNNVLLSRVDWRCKNSIMLWKDDEEGHGEGGNNRRHLRRRGDNMLIRQEDERMLGYNRRQKIRTTWRLHMIHNPLEGRYEEQSISLMKMKHWTHILLKKKINKQGEGQLGNATSSCNPCHLCHVISCHESSYATLLLWIMLLSIQDVL